MDSELLDLVKKHLPAMQVDALRAELDKAKEVDRLQQRIKSLEDTHQSDLRENSSLRSEISRLKVFEAKADEVAKQERDIEIKLLKKDVECANSTLSRVENLAMSAFRNPTVYKSFSKEVPQNNNGYQTTSRLHSDETTRVD